MLYKKIRGHKRKWKQIDLWKKSNLDIDFEYLNVYQKDYVKINVHPWSSLSLIKSSHPQPYGKTKLKILQSLLEIYDRWQIQLDKLGKPYYLKIWLYEPHFSNSQVVCAIGSCINYYNELLYQDENDTQKIDFKHYEDLGKKFKEFNWKCFIDEEKLDSTIVGEPTNYPSIIDYKNHRKWFLETMKKTHRVEKIREGFELYFFKSGCLWTGGE